MWDDHVWQARLARLERHKEYKRRKRLAGWRKNRELAAQRAQKRKRQLARERSVDAKALRWLADRGLRSDEGPRLAPGAITHQGKGTAATAASGSR